VDIGTGADADENSLLFGEAAGHGDGFVVGDLDALDDLWHAGGVGEVKVAWNEAGSGALDFVGPWLEGLSGERLGDHRGILGLDGDGLECGFAGAEGFDNA
jgi:hypothetical protein